MECSINVCFVLLEIVKTQIFLSNLMNRSQENWYWQDVWAKKIFPKYHSGSVRSILYLETINLSPGALASQSTYSRIIFFLCCHQKKCPSFVLSPISLQVFSLMLNALDSVFVCLFVLNIIMSSYGLKWCRGKQKTQSPIEQHLIKMTLDMWGEVMVEPRLKAVLPLA